MHFASPIVVVKTGFDAGYSKMELPEIMKRENNICLSLGDKKVLRKTRVLCQPTFKDIFAGFLCSR